MSHPALRVRGEANAPLPPACRPPTVMVATWSKSGHRLRAGIHALYQLALRMTLRPTAKLADYRSIGLGEWVRLYAGWY